MRRRRRLFALGITGRLKVFWRLVRDARTPLMGKVLVVGAAVGYALLPFDVVPEFLPGIGLIDDLIIVPLILSTLTWLAPSLVRREIIDEVMRERRGDSNRITPTP